MEWPLFDAIRRGDVAAARQLLASGVNPRLGDGHETSLHAAVRAGSLAMVETLIEGGALEWLTDDRGRTPLEVARTIAGPQRDAIVAILDRPAIADPVFREAVRAIHAGNVAGLEALLDADPRLLTDRAREPEPYRNAPRPSYFLDPKLFWFVANNPTLVEPTPRDVVDVARAMIARGVEQSDLDYTLGLVMTNSNLHEEGLQRALITVLLDAGAEPTRESIVSTAGHGGADALRAIVDRGHPVTPTIAATLGDAETLAPLLANATPEDVQEAFGIAVINGHVAATQVALDAGADVNAFLPVHSHGTALHAAAIGENIALIDVLLERGARMDTRDTLWDATPLGWATHQDRALNRARLERAGASV